MPNLVGRARKHSGSSTRHKSDLVATSCDGYDASSTACTLLFLYFSVYKVIARLKKYARDCKHGDLDDVHRRFLLGEFDLEVLP